MIVEVIETREYEMPVILEAEAIAKLIREVMKERLTEQESFMCVTLDGASKPIAIRILHIGTLNQSLVHPREVFVKAIEDRAAGIILIHNHPSGTPTPSRADDQITERIIKGGKILGIEVLDHVIVTESNYYSYQEEELWF